jgi:hypothetical protein
VLLLPEEEEDKHIYGTHLHIFRHCDTHCVSHIDPHSMKRQSLSPS